MLVLAVEGEQPAAEQLQVGGRGGAAGDEGGGSPRGRDPPPQHDLLRSLGQALGDLRHLGLGQQPLRQVEDPLDPGLLGAGTDDLRPRLAAHQQVERVGQHGLAGAGLPGDRVQPLPQPQLGLLDQQQVLDPQLSEHAPLCSTWRGGSCRDSVPPPLRAARFLDGPAARLRAPRLRPLAEVGRSRCGGRGRSRARRRRRRGSRRSGGSR